MAVVEGVGFVGVRGVSCFTEDDHAELSPFPDPDLQLIRSSIIDPTMEENVAKKEPHERNQHWLTRASSRCSMTC